VSVLTFAFEKLDVRDRMNRIALVCTSWAAAAAAATRSIELNRCSNTDSLQQWLRSSGSHVIKVKLQRPAGNVTSLPCPRLEWLVLEYVSVDLRPCSQLLQDLCAATALEHLHLDGVEFQGEPDLWTVLLSLPALKSVHLACITEELDSPRTPQQQSHASTATAVQDSQAVSHSLFWSNPGGSEYMCFTDEGMQFMCKLTKLQSLELRSMAHVTAAGLAGLHNLPALKRLGLEDLSCEISASAVPALTQLTALTCLKLVWISSPPRDDFTPSVLAHMTQLEQLELNRPHPAGGSSGAAELLVRLAQLTELQVLHLAHVNSLLQCPHAAFSSLTSSSVLRSLTWSHYGYVYHCCYSKHSSGAQYVDLDLFLPPSYLCVQFQKVCARLQASPALLSICSVARWKAAAVLVYFWPNVVLYAVPCLNYPIQVPVEVRSPCLCPFCLPLLHRRQPGPWQHVFPDSLRLSTLTELDTAYGLPWDSPDLDRLVSSCSHLQKLSLRCTPGLQLTALLQLTDLVQLWLEGKPDSSTMTSLAQLTGLRGLQRLAVTCDRFNSGLFNPLTALTQLTYLALPCWSENGSSMQMLLCRLGGNPLSSVDQWPNALSAGINSKVSSHPWVT